MNITENQFVDSTNDFGERLANSILDAVFDRSPIRPLRRLFSAVGTVLFVAASLTLLVSTSTALVLVLTGLVEF